MAEQADILVIGAGVMGASIAYHLSRQGAGSLSG
jgi:glycine/D-amino acid oxidase-like deaminating enzyme